MIIDIYQKYIHYTVYFIFYFIIIILFYYYNIVIAKKYLNFSYFRAILKMLYEIYENFYKKKNRDKDGDK